MIRSTLPTVRRVAAVALVAPLAFTAAACSTDDAASSKSSQGTSSASSKVTMASSLKASDGWAKAAESGMSAAFGTWKNTGSAPVVITGASGDAGPVQLHVTTKTANGMEMKETSNFTLAPGGTLKLAPGGNHLMFMKLSKALAAGDEQHLTVTFKDGSSTKLTFPVRAYDGAKEKYSDAGSGDASPSSGASSTPGMSEMPGMSHSSSH